MSPLFEQMIFQKASPQRSRLPVAELRNGPAEFELISESSSAISSDDEETLNDLALDSEEDIEIEEKVEVNLNQARLNQHFERREALKDKKFAYVEVLRKQLRFVDTLTAVVGLSGTTIAFIENESYYNDCKASHSSNSNNALRLTVSLATLFLLVLVVHRSKLAYALNREKKVGAASVMQRFVKTWHFRSMFIELLINAVHWPPYMDGDHEFHQLDGKLVISNNAVFTTFTLMRFYLFLRLFQHSTKWSTRRAEMICEEFGCEADTIFGLKAVLKDNPLEILGFFVFSVILILGMAVRQFERPFSDCNPDFSQDYNFIWNCMWMIVISMTTVGYGDFVPRTHMGRVFVVQAIACGIFLISLIVVTMTVSSQFTSSEAKAFSLFDRLNAKEASRREAAQAVKYALMLRVIQSKRLTNEFNDCKTAQMKHLMSQHLAAFKRELK
jgi:DNA-binding XRE family transcriptional regulator